MTKERERAQEIFFTFLCEADNFVPEGIKRIAKIIIAMAICADVMPTGRVFRRCCVKSVSEKRHEH